MCTMYKQQIRTFAHFTMVFSTGPTGFPVFPDQPPRFVQDLAAPDWDS